MATSARVSLHGKADLPRGCKRIKANLRVRACVCKSEIILYSGRFNVCVYERKGP